MDKEIFFTHEYPALLRKGNQNQKANWGVLSYQGMVEHMSDSVGMAWGRVKEKSQTPPAMLEKLRSFALSEKEFRPNTPNSLMSSTPAVLRNSNLEDAIKELEHEINNFIFYYHANPEAIVENPFFGPFNYSQWLHLLHKHAIHHLKQFSII
jgi:hypothetical protein